MDGRYPLMVASGTRFFALSSVVHWIANVTPTPVVRGSAWMGTIWYKHGNLAALPQKFVEIQVNHSGTSGQLIATVTFSGGGASPDVVTYEYKSPYFHPMDPVTFTMGKMELEFDSAEAETSTTTVDTCAHPNKPAGLLCETLSIEDVFKRAGLDTTRSRPRDVSVVPLVGAGGDAKWSDDEMHDAMQTYWSRYAGHAQWAMWVFFASLHERGTSLGGVMFDSVLSNQPAPWRQGCAIFNDSFIANPPPGEPYPAAWVQRMIFWTACHEIGHGFNLAHSWQKSLGQPFGQPWIPLANEPEARSFMNYPFAVNGGETAFFANFEYRFSPQELLFMRHAPVQFVEPGAADFFDHYGFQGANVSPYPTLQLELRVNREKATFEFMEPVTLELKLTNISSQPQLVDNNLLSMTDAMTVILKKDGKPARQLVPYARYCWLPAKRVLAPGESVYEALPVSAGRNGWDIAEPGNYTVQMALHVDEEDIVSSPLRVRVAPSRGYDEEVLAQDFFTDDVGRILTFGGTRFLEKGNETLHAVAENLRNRRVALHALWALGNPLAREYKQLVGDPKQPIKIQSAQPDEAHKLLAAALTSDMAATVESFGHINFKRCVDRFSDWLFEQGKIEEVVKTQDSLYQTLSNRRIHGRKILDRVLQEIRQRHDSYRTKK